MQTTIRTWIEGGGYKKGVVQLPEGYYRVLSGAVKVGDLHLHCEKWLKGKVEWVEIEFPEVDPQSLWREATAFLCLIRKGEPVEEVCTGCYERAKEAGYKWCVCCHYEKLAELRKERRGRA